MSAPRLEAAIAQAAERMNAVEAAIDAQHPTWRPGAQAQVRPLNEHVVRSVRAWMVLLLCAVGLVVALACANVANLRLVGAGLFVASFARLVRITGRGHSCPGRPRSWMSPTRSSASSAISGTGAPSFPRPRRSTFRSPNGPTPAP